MQAGQGIGGGKAWPVTLYVLSGLDGLLAVIGLLILNQFGWSWVDEEPQYYGATMVAVAFVLAGQLAVRSLSLAAMMRWVWTMAVRAGLPSRLWSWLGFVVPVVSYGQPLRTLWSLNARGGPLPGPLRLLMAAWWGLRLATCPTGFFVALMLIQMARVAVRPDVMRDLEVTVRGLGVVLVLGIAARLAECAVVAVTHRRQVQIADAAAARVF